MKKILFVALGLFITGTVILPRPARAEIVELFDSLNSAGCETGALQHSIPWFTLSPYWRFHPTQSGFLTSSTVIFTTIGQTSEGYYQIRVASSGMSIATSTGAIGSGLQNISWPDRPYLNTNTAYDLYIQNDGYPSGKQFGLNGSNCTSGPHHSNNLRIQMFGEPAIRTPVVIVPGIMGTRLNRVSDGVEVWPSSTSMIAPGPDNYLNDLKLSSIGQQLVQINPTEIIKEATTSIPFADRVFYKDLIDAFVRDGYVASTTLFTVPYDWRLDISAEIDRLDTVIQAAASGSLTGKVDIITHSMGGLLVKEYLRQATSTAFLNKLILAGIPELGAPTIFNLLNYGDDLDLKQYGLGLNKNKAKDIAQNMPGVYQLLPSRRYLQLNPTLVPPESQPSYVTDHRAYPPQYLNYDETAQFMRSSPNIDDRRNLVLLNNADSFHTTLDDSTFPASSTYRLIGCGNSETIGSFQLYPGNKVRPILTKGDGTVPLGSATNASTLNLPSNPNYYYFSARDVEHIGLVRATSSIELIHQIISETEGPLPTNISNSSLDCVPHLSAPRYQISTHSPVELHVYDSQDRHTGPDANGDIELGIPSSNYFTIGENSFAYVSEGGTYRVETDAINAGEFDLEIKRYTSFTTSTAVTYLNIPLMNSSTIARLEFASSSDNPDLEIDSNGDGLFETTVSSTAILNEMESNDFVPPVISLSNIPSSVPKNTTLIFNYSVTDDISGVVMVKGALNGVSIQSGAIMVMDTVGNYVFLVEAVDRAGNPALREIPFTVYLPSGGGHGPIYDQEQ